MKYKTLESKYKKPQHFPSAYCFVYRKYLKKKKKEEKTINNKQLKSQNL